jgi:hypothetical protein
MTESQEPTNSTATLDVLKVQLQKVDAERRMNYQGANALLAALIFGTVAGVQYLRPTTFAHGVGLLWLIPIAQLIVAAQYIMLTTNGLRYSTYAAVLEKLLSEKSGGGIHIGLDYSIRYSGTTRSFKKDSMFLAISFYNVILILGMSLEIWAVEVWATWSVTYAVVYGIVCGSFVIVLVCLGLFAFIRGPIEATEDEKWIRNGPVMKEADARSVPTQQPAEEASAPGTGEDA